MPIGMARGGENIYRALAVWRAASCKSNRPAERLMRSLSFHFDGRKSRHRRQGAEGRGFLTSFPRKRTVRE